jgi:hypothetical protein
MRNESKHKFLFIFLCVFSLALFSCGQYGGGTSPGTEDVYSSGGTLGAESLLLDSDLQITEAADDQSEPDVAYDSVNNQYLAVWTSGTTDQDVYGAIVSPLSNTVDAEIGEIPISAGPTGPGNQMDPRAAYDYQSDRYLVVWTDTRNGYGQIYGQLLENDGSFFGSNFAISEVDAGHTTQSSPSVVFNDVEGRFIVAWLDTTSDEFNYIVTTSTCGGYGFDPFTEKFAIGAADDRMVRYRTISGSSGAGGTIESSSGSVYTESGNWERTCASIVTAPEEYTEVEESITSTSSYYTMLDEGDPAVSYDPVANLPVLGWSGKQHSFDLTITFSRTVFVNSTDYDPTSSQEGWDVLFEYTTTDIDSQQNVFVRTNPGLGQVHDVKMGDGSVDSVSPDMDFDKFRNHLLVVWEEGTNDDSNIYGQFVDLDNFAPYEGTFAVSDEQKNQTAPRVAFDTANQRYMVVWEDARNTEINISNMDAYGQFIDPQGQLSGGNFPITVDSSNQIAPALVFGDDDSRRFLIAWKDGRNATDDGSSGGDADIYAQFWEYSVAPQLLITDADDAPIYTQAIDFEGLEVGQSSTATFRIWNQGNATLNIDSVTGDSSVNVSTTIDSNYPFNLNTPVPSTITPGSYYEMDLTFAPPSSGTYYGTITITSDGGNTILYVSGSATEGVAGGISITTASLPNGQVDVAYSTTLEASGGSVPYTWEVTSGALPGGVSLNLNSGSLSGTPSDFGTFDMIIQVTDNGGATDSQTFSLSIADAEGSIVGGSGGGSSEFCYIATAAYGSYLDPHVMALRKFRDRRLLTNRAGRELVEFYYRTSPPVAEFIARHEALRAATRYALTPIVFAVEYPLVGFGVVFAMGGAAFGLRRRGRSEK